MEAPTLRSVANIGMTIVAAVAAPVTGGASLIASIALNLVDDAAFAVLDVAAGYKGIEQAGLDFGKAALTTAATSAINVGFNGVGDFGGLMGMVTDTGIGGVVGKTVLSGLQSVTSTVVTSTINSFEIDGKGKLGFNSNAFTSSVKGGLTSTVGGMVNTFTAGTLNLGLEGFVGDVYKNGSKLSGFVGGLASQGVQYAMGGDFTMNILNTSMFGAKNGTGLFELRFGRDGFRAGIGMGGMDASFGTIASAIKGLEAWKVNAEIWGSDEAEASRYTSSLRTLYSSDEVTRAEYEAILAGKTNVVERGSVDYTESVMMNDGTKNIYLGSDALNDGNRFGLNVVFAHEAYRDGIVTDDNYLETREAVEGHIATAEKLIQIYGPDVLGEGYALEVALFNNAKETGEEILSLDELGMNDDSDYTTSLARILGISNAEASSSGDIRYKGSPWNVKKNTSSGGSVREIK